MCAVRVDVNVEQSKVVVGVVVCIPGTLHFRNSAILELCSAGTLHFRKFCSPGRFPVDGRCSKPNWKVSS